MQKIGYITALGLGLLFAAGQTMAAQEIPKQPIEFPQGKERTRIAGALSGTRIIDYTIQAQAGQLLSITLDTDNPDNYFNLLPPEGKEPLFVGFTSGNQLNTQLPSSGEYRVRLYLLGSAADHNANAHYQLSVYEPQG